MSLLMLLLAKFLSANGVTATVCGDDLVIGAKCPAPAASRPMLSPPDGHTPVYRSVPLDPKSISNGF